MTQLTMQKPLLVRARVDLQAPAHALIAKTGRVSYIDDETLQSMPRGVHEEVEIHFFQIGRWVTDAELRDAYEAQGLKPVDPHTLIHANIADPLFADAYHNATHWRHADGSWRYLTFRTRIGKRAVTANSNYMDWQSFWWFGGVL